MSDEFKVIIENVRGLKRGLMKETAAALYETSKDVMALSKEMTPVLTSALKNSHAIVDDEPKVEGDKVSVTIEVGGPAAPYAIYVHENLEARHPVGQAKFLEYAVLAYHDDLPGLIARRIDLARAAKG